MKSKPSAGEKIAEKLFSYDKPLSRDYAAQEIDAAIRDSNAELVELLQKARAELHPVIHRVLYHQITEALARHGADKENKE